MLEPVSRLAQKSPILALSIQCGSMPIFLPIVRVPGFGRARLGILATRISVRRIPRRCWMRVRRRRVASVPCRDDQEMLVPLTLA